MVWVCGSCHCWRCRLFVGNGQVVELEVGEVEGRGGVQVVSRCHYSILPTHWCYVQHLIVGEVSSRVVLKRRGRFEGASVGDGAFKACAGSRFLDNTGLPLLSYWMLKGVLMCCSDGAFACHSC